MYKRSEFWLGGSLVFFGAANIEYGQCRGQGEKLYPGDANCGEGLVNGGLYPGLVSSRYSQYRYSM